MTDSVYKRIDDAVYRAERAVVVSSLLLMAVVVFLDVVHRSFAGEGSKLAMVVAKLAGWVGVDVPVGSPSYEQLVVASPWVLLVVFSALAYFGIRSTKRAKPIAAPVAAAAAVAGVLVVYGLIRLFLVLVPNGLIWSQDLALVLTLWVGFVGASMCTYENRHLRVEAAQKLLPPRVRPLVGFASGLFTALVCAALLWLSLRYIAFHRQEWLTTEGQGGLFPGMTLPKWVGFLALPLAFGFMTVRFLAKAVGALRGEVEPSLDPVAAATGSAVHVSSDSVRMPSDVATEARPREPDESSIETMTSNARMTARDPAVPRPQSKVPTEAHAVLPPVRASDDEPDPERTKEVDVKSIRLGDDTRELESGDVGNEEEGR